MLFNVVSMAHKHATAVPSRTITRAGLSPNGQCVGLPVIKPPIVVTDNRSNEQEEAKEEHMRTILLWIVVIAVVLPSSIAQDGRRRPGDPFPKGDTGLLHVSPAPGKTPHSL